MLACERMQINPYLSLCTKLKSKWIRDDNINSVTLNLIEEKGGNNLQHIGTEVSFLNRTPIVQTLRLAMNRCDLINLKGKAKDTINRTKPRCPQSNTKQS